MKILFLFLYPLPLFNYIVGLCKPIITKLHFIIADKNTFFIGRQALFVPMALTLSNPFINCNISESTVFVQACQYRFPKILILMMVFGDLGYGALRGCRMSNPH
jgi:hypothetical protein